MSLQLRRGTDAERLTIVFQSGEIIYVNDTKLVYVGDGVTLGGNLVGSIGSGSNIYVSETQPVIANEGDGWYQPSTQYFRIYQGGAFQSIKVHFSDIAFTIDDGIF